MNNQFSENLKKIRREHNLSQEQLADELGVSRQAISKWESAIAYPEMDKIIALCNKFNLNIDDLLHRDIKEVKGEEERKNKLNSIFDDFLKFITNSINLFIRMNFKSKIKCLFELFIIAFILIVSSFVINSVLGDVFNSIFHFLPDKIYYFVTALLDSILMAALFIISIIIITHIFKIRYLDYYEEIDNESNNKDNSFDDNDKHEFEEKKDKELLKKDDKKIVIRDPKHSGYKFISALFKIIIGVFKLFLSCFGLFVSFILVCLFISFIASFLLYKTGLFFIGLLLTILSSSVITIIILLMILNYVFNRKNDKKKMIWSFICSVIVFGIGCGTIFVGAISFDVVEDDELIYKTVTKEYNMKDDLILYSNGYYDVEYVKTNDNNLKIEYSISKYCEIVDNYNSDRDNTIMSWTRCANPFEYMREFIKNANEKKIMIMSDRIEKIIVYTNQNNINKLKANWINHLKKIEQENEKRNSYENLIDELEQKNQELQQQVYDLQNELNNLH